MAPAKYFRSAYRGENPPTCRAKRRVPAAGGGHLGSGTDGIFRCGERDAADDEEDEEVGAFSCGAANVSVRCGVVDVRDETKIALVIDDSATVRMVLRKSLEELGWVVFQADNGSDGFDLALEQRPRLAFVDYTMREECGTEVCGRFESTPELRDLPVILMSARSDKASESSLQHHSVVEVLPKPFQRDQVIAVVARMDGIAARAEEDRRSLAELATILRETAEAEGRRSEFAAETPTPGARIDAVRSALARSLGERLSSSIESFDRRHVVDLVRGLASSLLDAEFLEDVILSLDEVAGEGAFAGPGSQAEAAAPESEPEQGAPTAPAGELPSGTQEAGVPIVCSATKGTPNLWACGETISLTDIIHILGRRLLTGILTIDFGDDVIEIYLERGNVVCVEPRRLSDRICVRRKVRCSGKLVPLAYMKKQLPAAVASGESVYTVAVREGHLEEGMAAQAMIAVGLELLADCLDDDRGYQLTFIKTTVNESPAPHFQEIPSQRFLLRLVSRADEWRVFKQEVYDPDALFCVVEGVDVEGITLPGTSHADLLRAIGDGARIDELAEHCGLGTFYVCRVLKGLIDDGVVQRTYEEAECRQPY